MHFALRTVFSFTLPVCLVISQTASGRDVTLPPTDLSASVQTDTAPSSLADFRDYLSLTLAARTDWRQLNDSQPATDFTLKSKILSYEEVEWINSANPQKSITAEATVQLEAVSSGALISSATCQFDQLIPTQEGRAKTLRTVLTNLSENCTASLLRGSLDAITVLTHTGPNSIQLDWGEDLGARVGERLSYNVGVNSIGWLRIISTAADNSIAEALSNHTLPQVGSALTYQPPQDTLGVGISRFSIGGISATPQVEADFPRVASWLHNFAAELASSLNKDPSYLRVNRRLEYKPELAVQAFHNPKLNLGVLHIHAEPNKRPVDTLLYISVQRLGWTEAQSSYISLLGIDLPNTTQGELKATARVVALNPQTGAVQLDDIVQLALVGNEKPETAVIRRTLLEAVESRFKLAMRPLAIAAINGTDLTLNHQFPVVRSNQKFAIYSADNTAADTLTGQVLTGLNARKLGEVVVTGHNPFGWAEARISTGEACQYCILIPLKQHASADRGNADPESLTAQHVSEKSPPNDKPRLVVAPLKWVTQSNISAELKQSINRAYEFIIEDALSKSSLFTVAHRNPSDLFKIMQHIELNKGGDVSLPPGTASEFSHVLFIAPLSVEDKEPEQQVHPLTGVVTETRGTLHMTANAYTHEILSGDRTGSDTLSVEAQYEPSEHTQAKAQKLLRSLANTLSTHVNQFVSPLAIESLIAGGAILNQGRESGLDLGDQLTYHNDQKIPMGLVEVTQFTADGRALVSAAVEHSLQVGNLLTRPESKTAPKPSPTKPKKKLNW